MQSMRCHRELPRHGAARAFDPRRPAHAADGNAGVPHEL